MTGASRLDRERAFHDTWAQSVRRSDVAVRAAFENLTAPENRFILERMGPLKGKRILDLGSGLGESAIYFALQGAIVTATDISPEMCAQCLETGREYGVELEVVATPIEQLAVPEASFDFVYGANLLHHLGDVEAAFVSVRRALRPGGQCFFIDPLEYNPIIGVYRYLARAVRSDDERPLRFSVLKTLGRHFDDVDHAEFWLTTQVLFLKYFLFDRLNPGKVRYWKRILEEDPARIGPWFRPLLRLDAALLRLPLVRGLAWNMVMWGRRPE